MVLGDGEADNRDVDRRGGVVSFLAATIIFLAIFAGVSAYVWVVIFQETLEDRKTMRSQIDEYKRKHKENDHK